MTTVVVVVVVGVGVVVVVVVVTFQFLGSTSGNHMKFHQSFVGSKLFQLGSSWDSVTIWPCATDKLRSSMKSCRSGLCIFQQKDKFLIYIKYTTN